MSSDTYSSDICTTFLPYLFLRGQTWKIQQPSSEQDVLCRGESAPVTLRTFIAMWRFWIFTYQWTLLLCSRQHFLTLSCAAPKISPSTSEWWWVVVFFSDLQPSFVRIALNSSLCTSESLKHESQHVFKCKVLANGNILVAEEWFLQCVNWIPNLCVSVHLSVVWWIQCDGTDLTAKVQDLKLQCLLFLNIPR